MGKSKTRYILINVAKALIWLMAFAAIYIIFKKYVNIDFLNRLQPLFDNEILILMIFLTSEIVVGIIPPEIFIIWALRNEIFIEFIALVALLSVISYMAGIVGYLIGMYLNRSIYYRLIKRKFLSRLDERLQSFGIYLILIAALTPLPFSGVSMLIGSVRFPFKRFVFFSLSRFLRFIIYAYVFWNLDMNI